MATIVETLRALIDRIGRADLDMDRDDPLVDSARRYAAIFAGEMLPETDDENASFGLRSIPPDETDFYHASHRSLPACPFCVGVESFPMVSGEINPRTSIIVYRVECPSCHASVMYSSRQAAKWPRIDPIVREVCRDEAIKRWKQRRPSEWEVSLREVVGALFDATDRHEREGVARASAALRSLIQSKRSWESASCKLCGVDLPAIPAGAVEGAAVVCVACLGKYKPTGEIPITPVDLHVLDGVTRWRGDA